MFKERSQRSLVGVGAAEEDVEAAIRAPGARSSDGVRSGGGGVWPESAEILCASRGGGVEVVKVDEFMGVPVARTSRGATLRGLQQRRLRPHKVWRIQALIGGRTP
jgi:hypothetical protein